MKSSLVPASIILYAGKAASTEEMIALARAASVFGGIYISHIRDEADKTFDALNEAILVGREARLPVQISHIKLGSVAVWGRAKEAVALINKARARGQDITADCYPYDAWRPRVWKQAFLTYSYGIFDIVAPRVCSIEEGSS